jgi:hypothetical protein
MKKKVGGAVLAMFIFFAVGALADSIVLKDGTRICNYKNEFEDLVPTVEICSKRIEPDEPIWFNLKKEGYMPVWTYFLVDGELVNKGFYKLPGLKSITPVSRYNNGNWLTGYHTLTIIMTPIRRVEFPWPWAPFILTSNEWLGYPPCGYVTVTNTCFLTCSCYKSPCCCH